MRAIKLLAIVLALSGARCTDTGDLQRMLRDALAPGADGEAARQTVGDVARARPDPGDPSDTGQPVPLAGTMRARVRNMTDKSAEVTIRFLLNGLVVHFARLHVGPHTATSIIGPDLAQVIEFTATDEDGTELPPETFVFGVDADEDTPAVYVISAKEEEEEPEQPVVEDREPSDEPPEAEEPQEPEEPDEEEGPPPAGGGGPPELTDCNDNGIADADDIAAGTSSDCNLNLVPDECDVAAGTSQDCNRNDVPDECDIAGETHLDVFAAWLPCLTGPDIVLSEGCEDMDLDADGDVDLADFAVMQRFSPAPSASHDCNSNGIPDECEIHESSTAPGGPYFCETDCDPDCNINGVPDVCDIAAGTSFDCNLNVVPDECDIAAGTSDDANSNGVPDECDDCNANGTADFLDIALGASADCQPNAFPDECDIATGTSDDANSNGVPDECEDCNSNGTADVLDIALGTSADCNENWFPDECDIAAGTSDDCNTNSTPDECDEGTDLNENGILDECEDCNGNGTPDDLDIAWEISADCNTNRVPDECDITGGTSGDCNVNGVPDECDIAAGTSADENSNGVPDECKWHSFGGHVYALTESHGPWVDAEAEARTAGGHLATINGAAENDWLMQTFRDSYTLGMVGVPDRALVWIGYYQDRELPWKWVSGEPVSYTNLHHQFPQGGVHAYLHVIPHPDVGTWNADPVHDDPGNDSPLGIIEAPDCNSNGSPDHYDVDNGTSQDCNTNGTPDECDIAAGTSADEDGNGVPDECERALRLDIKPGECPNAFNRSSQGALVIALLGTPGFDPATIDVPSVRLARADGVGDSAAPHEGPQGPHSVLEDVATLFEGQPCDCHDLTGDGIVDLWMNFDSPEVVDALLLNNLPAGATVELVVTGRLLDETPFEAHDCIWITPGG